LLPLRHNFCRFCSDELARALRIIVMGDFKPFLVLLFALALYIYFYQEQFWRFISWVQGY
jgi:hypothetical protein